MREIMILYAKRLLMKTQLLKGKIILISIPLTLILIYSFYPVEKTIRKRDFTVKKCFHVNESVFSSNMDSSIKYNSAVISNKTIIGILIPSTTRSIENPTLSSLSLISVCIPSLLRTMEPQYIYTIYIGIDLCDVLVTQVKELKAISPLIKPLIVKGGTFTKAVNEIARQAYKDGVHYIVRINDDSLFTTINWTSLGIETLNRYNPPNVGVVGPTCLEGKTDILTHDMVHRTHLEIFNNYYPPVFDNWWTDDWMTHVYAPYRSTKLSKWIVKHERLNSDETRYEVTDTQKERLEVTLKIGKQLINKAILRSDRYDE